MLEQIIRNSESDRCPRTLFPTKHPLDIFLESITITHSNSTAKTFFHHIYRLPVPWMEGLDKSADKGNMKWQEYEPKKWEETDVDIQVS